MLQQIIVAFIRRLVSTGFLLGVDDVEDALTARISQAQQELPTPRTPLIEATARGIETDDQPQTRKRASRR